MQRATKYLNTKDSDTRKIKVEVYYNKGGTNMFTSRQEPRGFWISVSNVECTTSGTGIKCESCNLFDSGIRRFLLECKRYSDKKFAEAVELANKKEKEMIEVICNKYNLKVA